MSYFQDPYLGQNSTGAFFLCLSNLLVLHFIYSSDIISSLSVSCILCILCKAKLELGVLKQIVLVFHSFSSGVCRLTTEQKVKNLFTRISMPIWGFLMKVRVLLFNPPLVVHRSFCFRFVNKSIKSEKWVLIQNLQNVCQARFAFTDFTLNYGNFKTSTKLSK